MDKHEALILTLERPQSILRHPERRSERQSRPLPELGHSIGTRLPGRAGDSLAELSCDSRCVMVQKINSPGLCYLAHGRVVDVAPQHQAL